MENNEIMQQLLQDDTNKSSPVETEKAKKTKGSEESQVSKVRIVTAKYKVYIVLCLIFIALLRFVYINDAKNALASSNSTYDNIERQLTNIENMINVAKKDMSYLCDEKDGIIKNEKILRKCLNEDSSICWKLPTGWKTESWDNVDYTKIRVPLSYLQLHSLYNKKMAVDEKAVLRNLNEYIIKQDISWEEREKVWEILRIEIWDPVAVTDWDTHFFEVTIDTQIKFANVDELVGFLSNIEKKIIENGNNRILYKIQTVSYDIITNDEPQITDISMIAYYYHDNRFADKTITLTATVKGENITLEKESWDDVALKWQIVKTQEIKANDLVEISNDREAEFKDWKGIDITKEWVPQKITINILAPSECQKDNTTSSTKEDIEDTEELNESESFLQTIFNKF